MATTADLGLLTARHLDELACLKRTMERCADDQRIAELVEVLGECQHTPDNDRPKHGSGQ